jgi:hypothetical protein
MRSVDDWATLTEMWDAMSNDVDGAWAERQRFGSKLALERIRSDECVTYDASKYPKAADGGVIGPWAKRNHPDEWITTQWAGGTVREVRIAPGSMPALDDLTKRLHELEEFRRTETEAFLRLHLLKPGKVQDR